MTDDPKKCVLGVLAGAGEYPRLMVEGAKRAGVRVVVAGFRGAVDKSLSSIADSFRLFRVGAVEAPRDFFRSEGVTHIVLTGQIKPASIYTMWPDATARRLLAELDRRNAHTIFGAVCRYITECGMEVLPSIAFMEKVLPGSGHLAGPAPTRKQLEEAHHGMCLAREIARLDIGQSLIVHDQEVVCVEAYKGTNECIRSGGGRPYPVTLCKVTKPGHDMRFDVPCIGVTTIRHCIRYNVRHICFEAGRTILFQQDEVIRLCNEHGITLLAMSLPTDGVAVPDPSSIAGGDEDLARSIAVALEMLGIGHSAIVCEGVVIAVEDPEGAIKCIKRAGAYMKRIRFMRLVNWLCGVLLGRSSTPPAPMIMCGTEQFSLTPEVRRIARCSGVQLEYQRPKRGAGCLSVLLILLVCLFGLYSIMGFVLNAIVYPGSRMDLPDSAYGYTETHIRIGAKDGTLLSGWFFNRGQGSPLVIIYHGNGQNVGDFISYALADTTRSYLLMNYRGYGESEGRPCERDIVADARHNLAWARAELGGEPASLTLVGYSLGSGVASQVSAVEKPDKLVLVCPFDSVESVACSIIPVLPRFLPIDSWKSVDYVPNIVCPVTVLRASVDGVIPPAHTDAIISTFAEAPVVESFPAGHNTIFTAPGFADAWSRAL